jgi:hypothetical protein
MAQLTEAQIEAGLKSLVSFLEASTPLIDLIPGAAPVMLILDEGVAAVASCLALIEEAKSLQNQTPTNNTAAISAVQSFIQRQFNPPVSNGDFYPMSSPV